jgi:hypothetical protein
VSPIAAQQGPRAGGVAGNKRLRSEEAEAPELVLMRTRNKVGAWCALLVCSAGVVCCACAAYLVCLLL